MREKIIKQAVAWLPVVLWAALIFRFSSGTVPVASIVYWQDFAVKKSGHVILFGFLALLIYRALRIDGVDKKRAAIFGVLMSLFYGATDEYHQMYTQGRMPNIRDVVIDGFGATLVVTALYYLPSRLSKKFQLILARLNLK
jgi:hypothetical protein